MNAIPVDGLLSVCVVVYDAHATAERYARVHGITEWEVRRYDAHRLADTDTHGFRTEQGFIEAVGVAETAAGPVTFALVQPAAGWTTYHEFLNTRGEGIHSICTAAVEPAQLDALRTWLRSCDVEVAQSARRDGTVEHVLFDTRAKLGGFYVEVLAPAANGSALRGPANETWRFPAPPEPLMTLGGIVHFGVVVPDLMAATKHYAELFGQTGFSFRNWRNAPGSLDRPTYYGRPVEHAYFTTMVTPHERVAFEVIQPTIGPSHYKEDFLIPLGSGIHHVHGGMQADIPTWESLRGRMEAAGIPVVMSGGILENFLDFYYLDTRTALAGYVVEVVVPGANFARGRPNVPFAMVADLAAPVTGAR